MFARERDDDHILPHMFSYRIHPARQRIDVHVGAKTSGAELVQGIEALLDDAGFNPSFAVFIDLRELEVAPSVAELAELANFIRARATDPDARRAFVTSSPVFYELALLFTRLTKGAVATYRVFREVEDAESWLGGAALPEQEDE